MKIFFGWYSGTAVYFHFVHLLTVQIFACPVARFARHGALQILCVQFCPRYFQKDQIRSRFWLILSYYRYIMLEQKKAEDFGITEDDVSEIRQDINKFRFELLDILRKNKFDIGKIRSVGGCYGGRRAKQMERRIMKVGLLNIYIDTEMTTLYTKGFTLEIYDLLKDSLDKQDKNKSVDIFQVKKSTKLTIDSKRLLWILWKQSQNLVDTCTPRSWRTRCRRARRVCRRRRPSRARPLPRPRPTTRPPPWSPPTSSRGSWAATWPGPPCQALRVSVGVSPKDSFRNLTSFTPGRWRGCWALCSQ